MVRRPARTAVRIRHPRMVLAASHGGRRHMSIPGRGEDTAGPALHADVLAGLNDEQRAAAICFLTCASAATATPWNGTRCGRRVRSACTVGLGIAAAERP